MRGPPLRLKSIVEGARVDEVSGILKDLLGTSQAGGGMDSCSKAAARCRLLAAAHALRSHPAAAPAAAAAVDLALSFIQGQHQIAHVAELRALSDLAAEACLSQLVRDLMAGLSILSGREDGRIQASASWVVDRLLLPALRVACKYVVGEPGGREPSSGEPPSPQVAEQEQRRHGVVHRGPNAREVPSLCARQKGPRGGGNVL